MNPLRWVWIKIRAAQTTLGYWARPYDSHRDARCWRWQHTRCRPLIVQTGETVTAAVVGRLHQDIGRRYLARVPWRRCRARVAEPHRDPLGRALFGRCVLDRSHLGLSRHAIGRGFDLVFFDAPAEGRP